jgi:hypothetical protein
VNREEKSLERCNPSGGTSRPGCAGQRNVGVRPWIYGGQARRFENQMKVLALIFFAGSYWSTWDHKPVSAVLLIVCSCVLLKFSEPKQGRRSAEDT